MDEKPVMLIVDDVEINRVVLAQFFQDEYTIIEAVNGQEALKVIESQSVSIVLVDLVMPVMDGFEVLSYIKHHDQYAQIPVIVMTARSDGSSEARAMEMGAADYIVKPYNPTIVRCRVKNVMARQENEWRKVEQVAKDQQLALMHGYIEKDSLTGIYNRETFYRKAAALMQANRGVSYNIVYLDISSFKAINDMFRIDTGNLVLKTAAVYFQVVAGDTGICGRIEADHFALCLPASQVDMDGIMEGLDRTIASLGISHNIVFHAGVYPVDNAFLPIDQMCGRAYMALSRIKDDYKARYAYYDQGMRDLMIEEQMIVRDMEFALVGRQFCIYLQPVYNIKTNEIVSVEALARWNHPHNGLISPARFIPVFERSGFIGRLDRFIWEEACRFLSLQRERGGKVVPVSVNVSRLDLYNLGLLDFLQDLLKKYELESWMLRLEVTESAYTDNPQQMIEMVGKLRASGFVVIMDDFGQGDSSLNLLKDLAVDALKIDMSLLQEVERSERAGVIMEAVIAMAKKLAMDIIVEGVETKAQVEYLAGIGCETIQGYYFSRPLPEADFLVRMLREQAPE